MLTLFEGVARGYLTTFLAKSFFKKKKKGQICPPKRQTLAVLLLEGYPFPTDIYANRNSG